MTRTRERRPAARRSGEPPTPRPLIVFAHGAGASSRSAWMQSWARRLKPLGRVVAFDYPYMAAGRRAPDRLETLIAAHKAVLARARARHRGPVILVGKSMGSRVGCHLALQEHVDAIVCLGYPLVSPSNPKHVRDEVLLALRVPILFVQGSRDPLCPPRQLARVRGRMKAMHALHVVEGGDHSLVVGVRALRARGATQDAMDASVVEAIAAFLKRATTRATLRASRVAR